MDLVMQVCDHLVVMEFGTLLTQGTPAHVQQDQPRKTVVSLPARLVNVLSGHSCRCRLHHSSVKEEKFQQGTDFYEPLDSHNRDCNRCGLSNTGSTMVCVGCKDLRC